MSYLNKRILFFGLNVNCLLVDLTFFNFGSDFSGKLVKFLLEVLRLNDNRFVQHTSKFEKLQFLPDIPNLFQCVFCENNFYGLKGGVHVFKAAKLPTSWLKIPKSVIVTGFPLSSF